MSDGKEGVITFTKEQQKKLDELGERIKRRFDGYYEKEYFRLNNIINELESYLNQEILEWQDVDNIQTKSRVEEDQFILDKLKELKENK